MVQPLIVYFVSLSCLSNPFLMRMCSCTSSSGLLCFFVNCFGGYERKINIENTLWFLYRYSCGNVGSRKSHTIKTKQNLKHFIKNHLVLYPGPKVSTLHINLQICFHVFLNNCRTKVIHEHPKCKQTNMKLVHPQASYLTCITNRQNIYRL